MKRLLHGAPGLSDHARRALNSAYFDRIVSARAQEGRPFTLQAVINRAASLDWSLLDLFYRLCGFDHFRTMFDLAEHGRDEGPICNLALISHYLSRFMDRYGVVITGRQLADKGYQTALFSSFIYALYRRGESEFEDADDPFPKGRIPFLTIHQSKGLEFPVVIVPNPRKDLREPSLIERMVRPFFTRDEGEPLGRMSEFDAMRMFYVALSRAKNLLIIAHLHGRGQSMNAPFKTMLDANFPRIADLDLTTVPSAKEDNDTLPRTYSFTADYLSYLKCPRQYMVFRKYGFAPSRSQTMFFGSLVHRTLEDLHNLLIAQRESAS